LSEVISEFQLFAESEISQFQIAVLKKDVVRFNVPVNDVAFIQRLVSVDKLPEKLDGLLFGHGSFFFAKFLQSATLTKFVNEIQKAIALDDLFEVNDVGVVLKRVEDLDLVFGEFDEFGFFNELVKGNHLDGDVLLGGVVDGFVDFAVFALVDVLDEGVS
jgi:hypothetical protein